MIPSCQPGRSQNIGGIKDYFCKNIGVLGNFRHKI